MISQKLFTVLKVKKLPSVSLAILVNKKSSLRILVNSLFEFSIINSPICSSMTREFFLAVALNEIKPEPTSSRSY